MKAVPQLQQSCLDCVASQPGVAAHRVDLTVYYRRLKQEEFLTLEAIRNGFPLAEALETGFRRSAIDARRRPEVVREWFASWAEFGWICAPDLESMVQQ